MIQLEICDCYNVRTRARTIFGGAFRVDERYGVCYGTKECDECSCGGDPAKCDFYPEKRRRAEESHKNDHNNLCQKEDKTTTSCVENNNKCTFDEKSEGKEMNTAQMWLAAQSDGKTYKVNDMRYSRQKGFHDKKGFRWNPDAFKSIEEIMNCQWVECKEMTRAEAEKKLGVDIID